MTAANLPHPITFNRAEVGALLRFTALLNPRFFAGTGYSGVQMQLMAIGQMKPRPAVLAALKLEQREEGYLWDAC